MERAERRRNQTLVVAGGIEVVCSNCRIHKPSAAFERVVFRRYVCYQIRVQAVSPRHQAIIGKIEGEARPVNNPCVEISVQADTVEHVLLCIIWCNHVFLFSNNDNEATCIPGNWALYLSLIWAC